MSRAGEDHERQTVHTSQREELDPPCNGQGARYLRRQHLPSRPSVRLVSLTAPCSRISYVTASGARSHEPNTASKIPRRPDDCLKKPAMGDQS